MGPAEADGVLLLDLPEAARRLAISDRTVKRLIESGELATVTIRRRRLVRVCDLGEFVRGLGEEIGGAVVSHAAGCSGGRHVHGRRPKG